MPELPTKERQTLQGHTSRVNFAKYNKQGDYIISGSSDKHIKLWNSTSGACIKTYSGHGYEVLGLAVSDDNTKFTSCGGEKSVLYWDVANAIVLRRFSGHYQRINDVKFNKEGSIIFSASYDASVKIWDCRSQGFKPVMSLEQAKDSVTSLVVTDKLIISSCVDGKVRTYDIRNGLLTTDTVGHPVTSIELSKNMKCLLTSSLDSSIRLFDRDNGTLLNEYRGHINQDYKVVACTDRTASYVISGSEDGRILYWDIISGNVVDACSLHSKAVLTVAYHPKEELLLTASGDGLIKILQI